MIFTGLKLKISITLITLLAIGLLLTDVIVVVFWQRAMVKSDIEVVDVLVDRLLKSSSSSQPTSIESEIEEFCRSFQGRCVQAGFYYKDERSDAALGDIELPLSQLIEQIDGGGNRSIEIYDSVFRAFVTGERYLLLADGSYTEYGENGTFFLIWNLSPIYRAIKVDQRIVLVYLLVNVLVLSIIGFFRLANLVIKPIDRLIETADQYQVTNSVFYSEGKEHSEFSQLNAALANMLKRIESDRDALRENVKALERSNLEIKAAHREIVLAEKLASVGRLSAGFAHEIGNPIAIVQGYLELLKNADIDNEKKKEYGAKALDELERINGLVRQLLDYARETGKESEKVLVDAHLIDGIIDIVHLEKERAHIRVSSDFESGLTCTGSKEAVRQVLLNCLLNAIDAIVESGHPDHDGLIEIRGFKKEDDGNDKMVVEINDNGTGISEDQMLHAFDPFYSTKPMGKGTGLGLYVSHLIIESLGGRMWIQSNERGGATVSIQLPLCEGESDAG